MHYGNLWAGKGLARRETTRLWVELGGPLYSPRSLPCLPCCIDIEHACINSSNSAGQHNGGGLAVEVDLVVLSVCRYKPGYPYEVTTIGSPIRHLQFCYDHARNPLYSESTFLNIVSLVGLDIFLHHSLVPACSSRLGRKYAGSYFGSRLSCMQHWRFGTERRHFRTNH